MRATTLASMGLLFTLSAGADAQTVSLPPAPLLTVGANTKELVFDWDPVPGAVNYRLFANTALYGYFEPASDRLTRTRAAVPVAVHKQAWSTRRYFVQACNSAGCTRSNEVFPRDLMLDTIGYLKASNTEAHDGLGAQVAVSADGLTLAVTADHEAGPNNTLPDSGAIYVYRREGRRWSQQALLKASDGSPNTRLGGGSPLAFRYMGLSADGTILAVGAPTRERAGLANAGLVFVFQRAADNSWSEIAQFSASPAATNDYFGYSVDVASDGTYIKVSSMYPQGGSGTPEGRTHIWHWNGTAWLYSGAIAPHHTGDRCPTVRMTTDTKLLVSACRTPAGAGRLVTSRRVGDSTWTRVADQTYLWKENPNMALPHDGSWLAVHEGNTFYTGGAIGIYRRDNFTWVEDSPWIGSGTGVGLNTFGHALDFSRNGEYLAFSDPNWTVAGAGSMDRLVSGSSPDGAVLILKRRGGIPVYFYTNVIKAPNPGSGDRFGESVAFGGPDGHYLVVGAPREDSATTGVDGNQLSEAAADSGAAYLY
jgi:trimeric autotransporter adhesin